MTNFINENSNLTQVIIAFTNLLTDQTEALNVTASYYKNTEIYRCAYKLLCRLVFNKNSSALVKKIDLKAV
jgi:hypothetical protein